MVFEVTPGHMAWPQCRHRKEGRVSMALKVSKRGEVPPFIVMDVMRQANAMEAQGEKVLHMEVGQPSTGAPRGVIKALKKILGNQTLGYTDAFGISELRNKVSEHYSDWYGRTVDPSNIILTTGSSGGFVLSFLAAFDAGDRVALACPGYPAYRNILAVLGIQVVDIPVDKETNFQPTPAMLDSLQLSTGFPLDGLIIASPSNPTGTMLKTEDLHDLCLYCEKHGIRLISDEVYHGITYDLPAQTALAFSSQSIVINSFSKYFSMTGWRLGWLVVPEDLLRAVECLAQNLFISPPTVSQVAAMAVFDCHDELQANVRRYACNREILLSNLPRAGLRELAASDGSFYVYAFVGHFTNDSIEFCRRMLMETGVAATPGTDFDPYRGNRYMRLSFAGATSVIEKSVEHLSEWLAAQN